MADGDPNRRIAREIRAARAYSGKSRKQIAQDIGRGDETLGRWERGEWETAPAAPFLSAIADSAGIPRSYRDAGFLQPDDPAKRFASAVRAEAQRSRARRGSSPGSPDAEDAGDEAR